MNTSTPFSCPEDVYEWICGFINPENGLSRREFRLDRIKALARLAGMPEKSAPSIHVAGTKGKGSVTGMVGAILEASGKKVSCYFSPHVNNFRERLTMGKFFFDEDVYVKSGNELYELTERYYSQINGQQLPNSDPGESFIEFFSFFELFTLWFFLCSRRAGSEAMAVETGMGGRLDATNILDPLVSVITVIELEHTEYLGNTTAAIAGEKAGIIKPGRPLVLAEQAEDTLAVFKEFAARNNSRLIYFPDHVNVKKIHAFRNGTIFSLALKGLYANSRIENHEDLFVPIPGEIQAKNAGLAILAAKTAFPDLNEKDIREGLAGFSLPARFEKISDSPAVVVDGSHTGRSMELCVRTFSSLYGGGNILIFGCAAGKNTALMAEYCIPNFSKIIITTPGTFKKSFPAEVYETFANTSAKPGNKPEILFIPDTGEAISAAIRAAIEKNLSVLGTGSFYLAAEIRENVLQGKVDRLQGIRL